MRSEKRDTGYLDYDVEKTTMMILTNAKVLIVMETESVMTMMWKRFLQIMSAVEKK